MCFWNLQSSHFRFLDIFAPIWQLSLFLLSLFFLHLEIFPLLLFFSAYNILRILFSNITFVIKSVNHCCRMYFFNLILTKGVKKTVTKYGEGLFHCFLTYIVSFRKSVSVYCSVESNLSFLTLLQSIYGYMIY